MSKALKEIMKRKELKKKLGNKCVYCNCNNSLVMTIDHKTPLIRGGKDTDRNKQVACWICNQLKGALTHKEFLVYLDSLKKLGELCKARVVCGEPKVVFKHGYYPGFKHDMPRRIIGVDTSLSKAQAIMQKKKKKK